MPITIRNKSISIHPVLLTNKPRKTSRLNFLNLPSEVITLILEWLVPDISKSFLAEVYGDHSPKHRLNYVAHTLRTVARVHPRLDSICKILRYRWFMPACNCGVHIHHHTCPLTASGSLRVLKLLTTHEYVAKHLTFMSVDTNTLDVAEYIRDDFGTPVRDDVYKGILAASTNLKYLSVTLRKHYFHSRDLPYVDPQRLAIGRFMEGDLDQSISLPCATLERLEVLRICHMPSCSLKLYSPSLRVLCLDECHMSLASVHDLLSTTRCLRELRYKPARSAQMNFGDFWNMLAKTRPELETLELMGHSWLHFHGRDPCYYLLPMLHVKQLAVSLLEIARALVRLPPDVEMEAYLMGLCGPSITHLKVTEGDVVIPEVGEAAVDLLSLIVQRGGLSRLVNVHFGTVDREYVPCMDEFGEVLSEYRGASLIVYTTEVDEESFPYMRYLLDCDEIYLPSGHLVGVMRQLQEQPLSSEYWATQEDIDDLLDQATPGNLPHHNFQIYNWP